MRRLFSLVVFSFCFFLMLTSFTFAYASETSREEILKKYGIDADGQIVETYDVQQYIDEQRASQAPGWDIPLKYYDKDAGISFLVPAGWIEVPLSESRDILKGKFQNDKNGEVSIMYGSVDFCSLLSTEEKNISRSDIDVNFFTKEDFAEVFGVNASEVSEVIFGDSRYFKTHRSVAKTVLGVETKTTLTQVATVKNGWYFVFQIGGAYDSSDYADFEEMITSADFGANNAAQSNKSSTTGSDSGVGNLVVSIILTVVIYSLPIIIYRYAIRKTPVDKKKAKTITIVYAIIGFFIMSIVLFLLDGHVASGGALFLWSFVNYRVLVSGKEVACNTPSVAPEEETADIADEQIIPTFETPLTTDVIPTETPPTTKEEPAPTVTISRHFCHKCGTEALDGGLYCHRCGTKIVFE